MKPKSFQPSPEAEACAEHAKGVGGLLRHDAVAEGPQSVHPIGQPISASTNRGLKTRVPREVGAPPVAVVRAWWERGGDPSAVGDSPGARASAVLGVAHARTASVMVVPGCMMPVEVVARAASLASVATGVGHVRAHVSSDGVAALGRSFGPPLPLIPFCELPYVVAVGVG